jgi:hypothetical protein
VSESEALNAVGIYFDESQGLVTLKESSHFATKGKSDYQDQLQLGLL